MNARYKSDHTLQTDRSNTGPRRCIKFQRVHKVPNISTSARWSRSIIWWSKKLGLVRLNSQREHHEYGLQFWYSQQSCQYCLVALACIFGFTKTKELDGLLRVGSQKWTTIDSWSISWQSGLPDDTLWKGCVRSSSPNGKDCAGWRDPGNTVEADSLIANLKASPEAEHRTFLAAQHHNSDMALCGRWNLTPISNLYCIPLKMNLWPLRKRTHVHDMIIVQKLCPQVHILFCRITNYSFKAVLLHSFDSHESNELAAPKHQCVSEIKCSGNFTETNTRIYKGHHLRTLVRIHCIQSTISTILS